MRVVICWASNSGYMAACWRALASRIGDDLLVVLPGGNINPNLPFTTSTFDGFNKVLLPPVDELTDAAVADAVVAHRPDAVVVCGWFIPAYRHLRDNPLLQSARFIIGMDTPMPSLARALLTRMRVGRYVRRVDRIIAAGPRTARFARFLGVSADRIRLGVYGYDAPAFEPVAAQRLALKGWPRRFLYVGRYVPEKGIDTLIEGYRRYRRSVAEPWELVCCGMGPMRSALAGVEGVRDLGFTNPAELPAVFRDAGAFVIASRYEPWGVVLAEAMGTGLPLACTDACSAHLDLVEDGKNGRVVATDDAAALAGAMGWLHELQDPGEVGRRAQASARRFSSQAWADKWLAVFRELVPDRPA